MPLVAAVLSEEVGMGMEEAEVPFVVAALSFMVILRWEWKFRSLVLSEIDKQWQVIERED